MNKVEEIPVSRYQLINQMLSARRLDKEQEDFKTGEKISPPGAVCGRDVCDRKGIRRAVRTGGTDERNP